MPQTGAEPPTEATMGDEEKVAALQSELASMLGLPVDRQAVEPPRRDLHRPLRPIGGAPAGPPPVELDPAVVDAITSTVGHCLERLLPTLLEESLARVVPPAVSDALDQATPAQGSPKSPPDPVSAPPRAPSPSPSRAPAPLAKRAASTLRTLRRGWRR